MIFINSEESVDSLRFPEPEWSWTDIGAGIYSVDSGKDGLQIWKWFTAESDMKTDEDCDKKWTEFSVDTGITIATLEYFASKDNFGRYSIWQREEIEKAITTAYTEQTHVAIAKAFIACFPHELVCTDFSNSIWYYYKGHSWIRSNGNHIILFYLNEKFTPILYEIRSNLTAKANHVKGAEKGSNELYITMIQQLITQLGKSGFKKNIAEELKIYYYNANFVKFRDLNEFFTGCPNGVIDVRGHKAIFRHGKPEDFITKSACYYPEHYNMETLIVKEVLHYFHQVYRNKNVRGFVWRFFSSCLRGRNVNKIFAIFVGEGNNSKSMIFALLQLVLGSYVAHLPTSLITGKESGANNATPALVYALGAKLLIMEEPNPNEVAQSGTIKKLTGNVDKQFLRDCFQKGADIVDQPVTGKVVVVANEPLKIDDCQRAIWQRTVLVDHPSRWVHPSEAPLTEEEQFITGLFPDDPNFSMKLPTYAPACLWLLVYFYEDYVKEGMNQPKEVVESTDLFRIASNYYMAFIKDRVRQEMTAEGVPNTGMFIQLNETYNAFKTWWKAEQITQKPPDKTTFKKNMQIVLKANLDINDKWYGLRLEVPQPTAGTLGGLFAF
ncbi:MAG: VV D5-like helicase [Solivirus sp.]|uniref:VV D5-like helicase n=1 Tax=Solivirus sp. TaxID=2487772 RepID=A0A3G5AFY3_9VIRU|nr:MAG: VV D5-like helicase [Solivirus sp.]